jgi:hypothetical protein
MMQDMIERPYSWARQLVGRHMERVDVFVAEFGLSMPSVKCAISTRVWRAETSCAKVRSAMLGPSLKKSLRGHVFHNSNSYAMRRRY